MSDHASHPAHHAPFVVDCLGCALHGWTAGPREAPAVILTHGFTMDHAMFAALSDSLADAFRVVTWDVRGHGRSKPMGDFSIDRCAEDLLAILDTLDIDRATLVGHSMGGHISQQLAFAHPERVRAMVLLSTTCLTHQPPLVQTWVGPLTRAALHVWPHGWTTSQIGWIAGTASTTRRYARQASAQLTKGERTRIWAAILEAPHHEPDYRIVVPWLLMHGQLDVIVGGGLIRALAPAWAKREPLCEYVVIPGAGHNAHQDRPAFAHEAIRRFLEAHVTDE